jgi:hypothetical protein
VPELIDNIIKAIYPDGEPAWTKAATAERNKQLRAEYDRIVDKYGLQRRTARVILSKIIDRSMACVNGIIYGRSK